MTRQAAREAALCAAHRGKPTRKKRLPAIVFALLKEGDREILASSKDASVLNWLIAFLHIAAADKVGIGEDFRSSKFLKARSLFSGWTRAAALRGAALYHRGKAHIALPCPGFAAGGLRQNQA